MRKNFRLFIDMDDTVVDFGSNIPNIKELMVQEHYFERLQPLPFLHEVNKLASMCPENIYILSACLDTPYCKREKILWLKKYLPAVDKNNVIFTDNIHTKPKYLAKFHNIIINQYDILIDDFTKNVVAWQEAGGTAIKFKNSFNTHHPEHHKYIISNYSELFDIIEKIGKEIRET